jgi:hypothetical protein
MIFKSIALAGTVFFVCVELFGTVSNHVVSCCIVFESFHRILSYHVVVESFHFIVSYPIVL